MAATGLALPLESALPIAAPIALVADAYIAAARGEWDPGGDGFLVGNLSLHMVIDRLAGYEVGSYAASPAGRAEAVASSVQRSLGHLMRGPGHNVHGPGCDCLASGPDEAPAEVAF